MSGVIRLSFHIYWHDFICEKHQNIHKKRNKKQDCAYVFDSNIFEDRMGVGNKHQALKGQKHIQGYVEPDQAADEIFKDNYVREKDGKVSAGRT